MSCSDSDNNILLETGDRKLRMGRGRKSGRGRDVGAGNDDSFDGSRGGSSSRKTFSPGEKANRGNRGRGMNRGGAQYREPRGYHGRAGNSENCQMDVKNGAEHGWQTQRRSGGHSGFSTGSFGVMGDADSVTSSGSSSPENSAKKSVQLDTKQDFRIGAGKDNVKMDDVVDNGPEQREGATIQRQPSVEKKTPSEPVQPLPIRAASDTSQDPKRIQSDANESDVVRMSRGCARSLSYHTVTATERELQVSCRRYPSHDVLDKAPKQHLNNVNDIPPVARRSQTVVSSPIHCATADIAVYPSEPDLKTALERRGESTDPANSEREFSYTTQRRTRSFSQSLVSSPEESSFRGGSRSMRHVSVKETVEENEEFYDGEVSIRMVHHDDKFNNHRLSKLSIHTNNDEFFYVGGHPPSDGVNSLRSRGSVSRQSIMRSTDFLSGINGEEWVEEQSSASPPGRREQPVCETAYIGTTDHQVSQMEYDALRRPIPTIMVDGEIISGSSLTSHYVTATDKILSPERSTAVFDESCPHDLNDRSSTFSAAGDDRTTTVYSSTSRFRTSDANLDQPALATSRQSLRSSAMNVAEDDGTTTAHLYSSRGCLRASDANLDQPALAASRQSLRSSAMNVAEDDGTTTAHLVSSGGCLRASDANLDQPPLAASRQSLRSSAMNVAEDDGTTTAHLYSSRGCLRASDANLDQPALAASRQSLRSSAMNVAEDDGTTTAHLYSSRGCLRASDANLDQPALAASRQSLRSSAMNVAEDDGTTTAHLYSSRGCLRASDANLDQPALATSRQSLRSSAMNVAEDDGTTTAHLYSSRGCLRASDANLDQPALAASRQSLRSSAMNVAEDDGTTTAHLYSSRGCLRASHANLDQPALAASRQSLRSSAMNVAEDDGTTTAHLYSSRGCLRASDANLDQPALAASRQSLRSSAMNVAEDDGTTTAHLYSSRGCLRASDANLDQPALAASRQSLRSSAMNVAEDDGTTTAHLYSSRGCLRASDANLDQPALATSRQSLRSSAMNVAEDDGTTTAHLYSSRGCLRASDANLHQPALAASRQSLRSSAMNVAEDDGTTTAHLYSSRGCLRASDANLHQPALAASRQSLRSSAMNVAEDGGTTTAHLYSSRGWLRASDANLDQPALAASRQSLRSSAMNVAEDDGTTTAHLHSSRVCLRASDANLDQPALAASRQSLRSSAMNVAEDDGTTTAHLYSSRGCLRASDANLHQPALAASRQSLRSSAMNVAEDDGTTTAHLYSSRGCLRASDANLHQPALAASRQSLRSSAMNVAEDGGTTTAHLYSSRGCLRASDANLDQPALATSRQSLRSSAMNVAEDDGTTTAHLYSSRVCLRASDANLDQPPLATSRQSLRSSAMNVAEDDGTTTAHLYSSRGCLRASDANLDQPALAASRQSLRSSAMNVAEDGGTTTAHLYSSRGWLRASDANLDQPALAASRQSLRSSAMNVAEDDGTTTAHLHSSRVCLRASDANLDQPPLAASRQSLRSSAMNVAEDDGTTTAHLHSSRVCLRASDANLDQPALAASRQSLRSSAMNVAEDDGTTTAHLYSSRVCLRASDANLDQPPLAASRQSLRSSAMNVAEDDGTTTAHLHSSRVCLRASDANLDQPALAASRQSLRSSAMNVAEDDGTTTAHLHSSRVCLRASDANLDQPALAASRQSLRSSAMNDAEDDGTTTAQLYSSRGCLRASDANLDQPPLAASRQSLRSSAMNVAEDDGTTTAHLHSSRVCLRASDANLDQPALAAFRQSLRSSAMNVAEDDGTTTAHLHSSRGWLRASDANLDQPALAASRQSLRSSAMNVAEDDGTTTAHLYSSRGCLRASDANLDQPPLAASRQSLLCGDMQDDNLKSTILRSSRASLHGSDMSSNIMPTTVTRNSLARGSSESMELEQTPVPSAGDAPILPKSDLTAVHEPARISVATASPISRSVSRTSVSTARSSTGEKVNLTPDVESLEKCIDQPAAKSVTRASSQNSVHGFETANGGLWYHFSEADTWRNSSSKMKSNTPDIPARKSMSNTSQGLTKKLPRSRSTSATRRNEVHFSSIPQLHSHPDDRFGIPGEGKSFRPTAEHNRTPCAQKSKGEAGDTTNDVSQTAVHKTHVDLDTQLMTVPVHNTDTRSDSEMDPPSRTPSLRSIDMVPPALVVTNAITPKRAPRDFDCQDDYNSPAGFNRTHFTPHTIQRRRFKEPKRSEVAVQTGETIRLRQAMSFEKERPCVIEEGGKERMAPFGQTNTKCSFERFANNSFEKRGHPAPAVLTAMLQQRQSKAAGDHQPNPPVTTKPSEMSDEKTPRKRSFIDNQHHQYETRTQQEWRSSTRSQWEDGKLDENCNELRSDDWTDQKYRLSSGDEIPDRRFLLEKGQDSHLSDQVFEEREVIVERSDYYGGRGHHYTAQQKYYTKAEKVSQHAEPEPVEERRKSNVITRETVEQLRQSVVAESRLPSTSRGSTNGTRDAYDPPLPIDIKDLSVNDPLLQSSPARKRDSSCIGTPTTRISMNMKTPSPLSSPSSRMMHRQKITTGVSPFKWKVADVDIHREQKEPDARSNESRHSGKGSTVRRHVPRGRIRDLARLFDGMSKEASRQTDVLRGKSLQPPKYRSKFSRAYSLPRTQNHSFESITSRDVPTSMEPVSTKEPMVKEHPMCSKSAPDDGRESRASSAASRHFEPLQSNCYNEEDASGQRHIWAKHYTNDVPSGDASHGDDASTDSRIDLRRTSTPLISHVDGDFANAFGRLPPIRSPESSHVHESRRLESNTTGNFNNAETVTVSDSRDPAAAGTTLDHHYAQPMVRKAAPPPQRLSVIHPNTTQHAHYVQHKRSQSDQPTYTANVSHEPIYAKVHRLSATQRQPPLNAPRSYGEDFGGNTMIDGRRSDQIEEMEQVHGEIDRMFEFVEEHDGLSTLSHDTHSLRTSAVVKSGNYESNRGDVARHLPSFPPLPPNPPSLHHGSENVNRSEHPLKYSISGYRDMQRIQRAGRLAADVPPRFSPLTAPTPGIGVSTYKSREGTIGEKVSTISRYSRQNSQHPSALATSTPMDSPIGTQFSQSAVPNLDDSFKLNHQIRVQEEQIEMTLKVLALARKKQKSMQELSAQRTLLLARERLELLRCEVNRISALAAVRNPPPPVSRDLRGTMTISNITVHLNRSFCQHQYDHDTSYALLILLKCGAEVEATGPISLLAHQQTRIRHLTFAEHVQFANLPVDFNVVVEVYAMKLPTPKEVEQSCASNIANKCRNLLSPALTTRPGRALCRADSQVSEFVRCGYIILNRDTVGANKFYLDEAEYPLEGIIEVYARCTTLPPAIEVDNRGFLTMYQTVSGMASWERYWSVLRRGMVYFWRYPDDESLEKRPVAFMDLSKCTNDVVVACTPEQCPRENSFSIDMLVSTTPSMMEKKRVLLSADSNELLHAWLQALNETLSVLRG
ncbi:hypothetical protein Q1695_004652 [Nippostrongylus brasiliensis]|nr:hypothetical protein Q1695_004652 [Nippostrongylus brasiliensis]